MRPFRHASTRLVLDLRLCGFRPFRAGTIRNEINSTSVRISDSAYGQTAALSECKNCFFVLPIPFQHPSVVDLYRGMDDNEYHDSSSARRFQMRRLLDEVASVYPRPKLFWMSVPEPGFWSAKAEEADFTLKEWNRVAGASTPRPGQRSETPLRHACRRTRVSWEI